MQPSNAGDGSQKPRGGAGGRPSRAGTWILSGTVLLAAGCTTGSEDSAPEHTPPPPAPHPHLIASTNYSPSPDLRFVEASGHFLAGHYEAAAQAYVAYLNTGNGSGGVGGNNPQRSPSALWHLALIHLLPDSSLRDAEAAAEFLERLEEEYPTTVHAVQAAWLRETMSALKEAEETAAHRAALIEELEGTVEELEAMVEQLRRLHLERRPRLPPPDTLDGGDLPP